MIVFTPDGRGKVIKDKRCIEHVQQIMETTREIDIVYDRGAYVLDVDVNDGVYVNDERRQSGSDFWNHFSRDTQRVLGTSLEPSTQGHDRNQSTQQDVHGENQNTYEQVKVKVPSKLHEPTKEERYSHEATHCLFRVWCEICVKAKNTKRLVDTQHIPMIEFDYAFAAETLGDPYRNISMMIATDSIQGPIFCSCGKDRGWSG